jgi:hypothetical protein
MVRAWWVAVPLALVVACTAAGDGSGDDDEGNSGSGAAGGGLQLGGNSAAGGGSASGCSDAAKLIYVLTDQALLYSFQPIEKLFTLVGPMACPTTMQPNSMAIDRQAVAWVNYVESSGLSDTAGVLFRVSTADASCDPMPAVTLPNGFFRVGMGYSSDSAGSDAETLFVTGIGMNGSLGRIDGNNTLQTIGSFTAPFMNQDGELTGTGDARLFAFFTSNPVEVAEVDKNNAAIISNVPMPTVDVPNAWAFSFWGGDFYLYTSTGGNSRVNRYRPADGSVDTNYMPDVGFRIVGAGVSTCAPLTPPT